MMIIEHLLIKVFYYNMDQKDHNHHHMDHMDHLQNIQDKMDNNHNNHNHRLMLNLMSFLGINHLFLFYNLVHLHMMMGIILGYLIFFLSINTYFFL